MTCSTSSGNQRVLLAMSGGVDSSTAAVLLHHQGFAVVGCTMQLWDSRRNPSREGRPQHGRCCSLDDVYDARRIAEQLGFPFYVLNLEEEFERRVIAPFIDDYLSGQTPVPCTRCNTFLKFDRLLRFARQVEIDRVATGHYARTEHDPGEGHILFKGRDESKDQSYYLFELTQEQLARIEFPVGSFRKDQIRRIARDNGLSTAGKQDSQEICFVPDQDYAGFIQRHAGEISDSFLPVLQEQSREGPILMKDGTRVGTHGGIYRFTIGQRRGLGIAHHRPLYVLRLDVPRNAVIVGYQEDLFRTGLIARRVNWISGAPPRGKIQAEVKIRARHQQAKATVVLQRFPSVNKSTEWKAKVRFLEPQKSVTPGQAAVFYEGPRVLGGGWIDPEVVAPDGC